MHCLISKGFPNSGPLNVRWLVLTPATLFFKALLSALPKVFLVKKLRKWEGKIRIKLLVLVTEWIMSEGYIYSAGSVILIYRKSLWYLLGITLDTKETCTHYIRTTRTLNWERSRYGESARYFPQGGEMFVIIDTYLHPFVTFENHK